MKVILSIDPGVQGTGIAVWKASLWGTKHPPIRCFNFDRNPKLDWLQTIQQFVFKLSPLFDRYTVTKVYCEYPQYFEGSAKSQAATGSGDIIKLSSLIGAFMTLAFQNGSEFVPIKVNTWKGQVPKIVVERRICKLLPSIVNMKVVSHSWDAVGVGLFAQGILHPENLHLMNR